METTASEVPPRENGTDYDSESFNEHRNSDEEIELEETKNANASPSSPPPAVNTTPTSVDSSYRRPPETLIGPPETLTGLSLLTRKADINSVLSTPLSPIAPALPITNPSPKAFTVKAFRDWSLTTLKCTKQKVMERLGHGTKTVDSELELQIDILRDHHFKYQAILRQAKSLATNFTIFVQSQKDIADSFSELSQKIPQLHQEFACNAETQKALVKSGESLTCSLNFFTSNLSTLCEKTIEDTLLTVKQYEAARVEYDAYRNDFEMQESSVPKDSPKLEEARQKFDQHREKFDRLRSDLNVKIKLLDENKIKVMHRQLMLLQDAVVVYFSGNHSTVDDIMKRYDVSLSTSNSRRASFLESGE